MPTTNTVSIDVAVASQSGNRYRRLSVANRFYFKLLPVQTMAKPWDRATLKAFLTHICVLKDLAADGGQQKGRGEGSYTRFKPCYSGWAIHKVVTATIQHQE
jgi:hypothetical protein